MKYPYIIIAAIGIALLGFFFIKNKETVTDVHTNQFVIAEERNPVHNKAINPHHNEAINPIHNEAINPIHNEAINPIHNEAINPIHNEAINPIHNEAINPIHNEAINPIHNPAIHPVHNPNLAYFYYFNLNNRAEYIVVPTKENNVFVYLDTSYQLKQYAVTNGVKGLNIFSMEQEWIGYLVPDQDSGYVQFDVNNNWLGYLK